MIALLVAALSLASPPPPPIHHVILRVGSHATITVHNAHVRNWSVASAAIVSMTPSLVVKKGATSFTLLGTNPGSAAITIGCDGGGREVWLVDVR